MAKKKIVYFKKSTQDAIVSYNNETNISIKNKIYGDHIHKPMRKIIENIIHRFKFYHSDVDTMPQYIHEIETMVLEKLHLYDQDKGRAYSYFSWAIKTMLINYNRENYKRFLSRGTYDEVDNSDVCYKRYELNTYIKEEMRTDYYTDEFIKYAYNNIEDIYLFINKVPLTTVELATANAILTIMERRYDLDILDKKSMYIYVRNIVRVSNQKFLNVFKVIKTLYLEFSELHNEQDSFDFNQLDYNIEEDLEESDEIAEIFESYND